MIDELTGRTRLPVIAILLAAGSGTRSGPSPPKQFLRIGGLAVLEHTLRAFEREPEIDQIIIVAAEDWIEATSDIVSGAASRKVTAIVAGGSTRNESTRSALDAVEHFDDAKLIIHDAVRPLVSGVILRRCVEALDHHGAADVLIETADTIVEVDGQTVTDIPNRQRLRRGQTPQAFRLSVLRQAYASFSATELERFTDDCGVVLAALPEVSIHVVDGADENIKITRPIDIYIADRLLQARQSQINATTQPEVANAVVAVFGGSSGIGSGIVERLRELGATALPLSRSVGVDIRDASSVHAALQHVFDTHGRIDAVINCAGTLTRKDLKETSHEEIAAEVATNLTGAISLAKASHTFLAQSSGHLLLFTSSSYTRGRGGYATYSATKAGIVNLMQALAEEWRGDGVKVNCMNPGRTRTPMREQAFGDEESATLLTARDVAEESIRVISSTMTGHVFDVSANGLPR